jgi:hypothetical protein
VYLPNDNAIVHVQTLHHSWARYCISAKLNIQDRNAACTLWLQAVISLQSSIASSFFLGSLRISSDHCLDSCVVSLIQPCLGTHDVGKGFFGFGRVLTRSLCSVSSAYTPTAASIRKSAISGPTWPATCACSKRICKWLTCAVRRQTALPVALTLTGQVQNGRVFSNSVRHDDVCAGFLVRRTVLLVCSFSARKKGAEVSQTASASAASGVACDQAHKVLVDCPNRVPCSRLQILLPQVDTHLNGSNFTTTPQLSPNTVRDYRFHFVLFWPDCALALFRAGSFVLWICCCRC